MGFGNASMAYPKKTIIRFVAVLAFLANLVAMVKGNLATLPELFAMLMLGFLLLVALMWQRDDAVSYFLLVLFFIAAVANAAYLYSVAGYLNLARLGTLAIGFIGLAWAGYSMLMQPIPEIIRSDVRKLLAAEKKISDAKETLKRVRETVPKAAPLPKKKKAGKRRKR